MPSTAPDALSRLIQALNDQAPCGMDPAQDATFVQLRQRLRQHQGLHAEPVDWRWIEEQASGLLCARAKDLRAGVYLATAWLHLRGLSGLCPGLELVVGLLTRYPVQLHPQARRGRVVGRVRALGWYWEQVERYLEAAPRGSLSEVTLSRIQELGQSLSAIPEEQLQASGHMPKRLEQKLRAHLVKETAPLPTPTLRSAAPQTPAPVPSLPDALALAHSLTGDMRRIAGQILAQDPRNALGYTLSRQALWLQASPLTPQRAHQLPALSASDRTRLEEHRQHQRWPGLLQQSEDLLTRHRYCLDLQYYSVLALEGMDNTQDAVAAILAQTSSLLVRMPQLLKQRGAQGQAFASLETRRWLTETLPSLTPKAASHPEKVDSQTELQSIQATPENHRLKAIEAYLLQSRDKIQFAQRCLHLRAKISGFPGLGLCLLLLAHQAIEMPDTAPLHQPLERDCLSELLREQADPRSQNIPALRDRQTQALALALAKRDLGLALPYFHAQ